MGRRAGWPRSTSRGGLDVPGAILFTIAVTGGLVAVTSIGAG
jgi:hypothetical protein